MKKFLILATLIPILPLAGAEGNLFQAKLNIAKSENAVFNQEGLLYLPAFHIQKSDGILFESEQPHKLEYHNSDGRMQVGKDCTSIQNVRSMEFHFNITKAGKYRAWYRGSYPTNLAYNHRERMDNGVISPLIPDSENLPPNTWRWHKGPLYHLEKGKHIWSFPSPSAWCGGAKLDKLLLLPERFAAVTDENAKWETDVLIPERGEIVIRRIKTGLIGKWKMNADIQLNGGRFTVEYRYDGQAFKEIKIGDWEIPPAGVRYLYLRFRLEKAKGAKISPFVYNLGLLIQEK